MIHFDKLTTSRLNVQLRELPIAEAIRVARMPNLAVEAEATVFLRAAIADGGPLPDPELWTVQERNLAVCHYLMCIQPEGQSRDFAVGTLGKFSDYFDGKTDIPAGTAEEPVDLGVVDGTHYGLRHLLGYMAEGIERTAPLMLPADADDDDRRLHWVFGCMAAQLVELSPTADVPQDPGPGLPGAYDDWLMAFITGLQQMPESEFTRLLAAYMQGQEKLRHLFDWEISPYGGVQFKPGKEAAADLPPATFPSRTCLSPTAIRLGGNTR